MPTVKPPPDVITAGLRCEEAYRAQAPRRVGLERAFLMDLITVGELLRWLRRRRAFVISGMFV